MKSLSDKQLAANRANAARSTGPRTPEGKARAALNSRRHGLAASTFTASSIEDGDELEALIADAVDFYRPQNSQEQFAVERIALCQLAILRACRLEAGMLTSCFASAIQAPREFSFDSAPIDQKNNHALATGFQRQATQGKAWPLLLRYQAQADRQYRRAVEDFERLAAERPEFPNEPIPDAEPEQTEPDPPNPNEPIPGPQSRAAAPPTADPGIPPTPGPCPLAPVSRSAPSPGAC